MKDHFSDDSTNRTYDDPEQELQLLLHLIEEYLDWSDVSESVKALNFFLTNLRGESDGNIRFLPDHEYYWP